MRFLRTGTRCTGRCAARSRFSFGFVHVAALAIAWPGRSCEGEPLFLGQLLRRPHGRLCRLGATAVPPLSAVVVRSVGADRFQVVSPAPGEVLAREVVPIQPVQHNVRACRGGSRPIGDNPNTPLPATRIEWPVPPRSLDAAPLSHRGFRVVPSRCSTGRCSAWSAESASRRLCSSVPAGRGHRLRRGPREVP
jgi:hypothetical protein